MTEGRDTRGRFAPGCKPGPGNVFAHRVHELRAQLYACTTDAAVRAIFKRLISDARKGDKDAVRILFDRLFGKVHDAPDQGADASLPIELPDLSTAKGCSDGMAKVLAGLSAGDVDARQAAALLSMLDLVGRSIERSTFEERLRALEESKHEPIP
jgi:hypothetical protein